MMQLKVITLTPQLTTKMGIEEGGLCSKLKVNSILNTAVLLSTEDSKCDTQFMKNMGRGRTLFQVKS